MTIVVKNIKQKRQDIDTLKCCIVSIIVMCRIVLRVLSLFQEHM